MSEEKMTAPDAGGLPEPEFQNMRSALVRMLPDDPMQELCAEDLAISSAIETLDTLRAEAERLREDAERYRWLRNDWDNRKWRHLPYLNIEQRYGYEGDDIATAIAIDAAIDAARKEKP